MSYTKYYSGICPQTGTTQSILLTIETIHFAGHQLSPSQKVLQYSCPYASNHGCDIYLSDKDNCPLYVRAKEETR